MGALLVAVGVPTVVFGLFALLAVRFGAESRPYFDERPVHDDRPNWFPISRTLERSDDAEPDAPDDGEPQAKPAPRPRRAKPPQPALGAPASASSAAMSPSGVWSGASTSGS